MGSKEHFDEVASSWDEMRERLDYGERPQEEPDSVDGRPIMKVSTVQTRSAARAIIAPRNKDSTSG